MGRPALVLVGLIPTLSLAGTWTTSPTGNAADIIITDPNTRIGIGVPNTATRPAMHLHLAGTGGPDDGIRVSRGFLEVDGVNTYGGKSGGSENLRIGYFETGRVGVDLQGIEAATRTVWLWDLMTMARLEKEVVAMVGRLEAALKSPGPAKTAGSPSAVIKSR